MIKGLMGSNGIIVDSGNTALPYVNQNSNDTFNGVMRINGSDIQYYQNGIWNTLSTSYATVRLDPSTDSLLNWVREQQSIAYEKQRARDQLVRKAKTHPSLEKAFEAIIRAEQARDEDVNKAHENFTLLEKIIGEEEHGTAESQAPQSSP